MARRPDLPLRRALALGLPLVPFLASRARALGLAQAGSGSAPAPDENARTRAAGARTHVQGVRTLVLIRHAEKDPAGDPADPALSAAGKARAEALAKLLAPAGVVRLYASEFRRARETLEPLSKASGVAIEVIPAAKSAEALARLDALPAGSIGVLAGHSNTIPGVIAAAGREAARLEKTPHGSALSEQDYGRLFVLTFGPPDASGAPDASAGGPAAAAASARSDVALLELAYGA